jgi:sirohydrochlorin cobaltochelatase
MVLPAMVPPHATVVIVGGHEGGAGAPLTPLAEHGPLLRAISPDERLAETVHQALDSSDQPVCVVPMTMGRDPRLVADSARTLMALTAGDPAERVMLADAFGSATLLTGWLRVAANHAAGSLGAEDLALLFVANAANPYDDAELFRIARLVKVQDDFPYVEVAFHGGDPDLAQGVERCRLLGASRVAVIPADFGTTKSDLMPGVIDTGPLLSPSTISGLLASRVAAAIHKMSRDDDGIAAGLEAEHLHGHGDVP